MRDSIKKISYQWFLCEPALFSIYCSHRLTENREIECPVRAGKGRIEYNPTLLEKYNQEQQELLLRAELIRIALQHPYARLPQACSRTAISMASDMVMTSYYEEMIDLFVTPDLLLFPEKMCYEWYARRIVEKENDDGGESKDNKDGKDNGQNETGMSKEDGNGRGESQQKKGKGAGNPAGNSTGNETSNGGGLADRSELWEEDPWMQEELINIIKQIKTWGSLPGSLVEQIIAASAPKLDYRKVLSGFRASTLSSERNLTRMRPNRRTEFENLGSLYKLKTRYLCAVDVSGSIESSDLERFFSTINRFFKYGVDRIDVITCDTQVTDVIEFKKARQLITVCGGGGTNFQPVINYMEDHKEYDGLIFFTDGAGPVPEIHKKTIIPRILWFLKGEEEYNQSEEWMKSMGRVCFFSN